MKKSKKSIKFRLLFVVASLIVGIFALIFLAFNILFTEYVERRATELLDHSSSDVVAPSMEMPDENPGRGPQEDFAFAGNVERAILTSDYEVLFPTDLPVEFQETSDLTSFVSGLSSNRVELSAEESGSLEWEDNLYYYTVTDSVQTDDSFALFFINMTELYSFEQTLNQLLLVIMLVALIIALTITYMIAARMARPIRELSFFAKQIGEGEYQTIDEEYGDLELHELKNAMNETTKKLKAVDAEQRTFFQNASHELRTPLQIIKTNAEGIEYGLIDNKKGATVIQHETDKLGDLVEDILFLSRLESRSADRIDTVNDLRETLSYTVERYSDVFRKEGIQVEFDFSADPVMFKYDERDFERAFQNLLSNALRYSRGLIRVGCRKTDDRIILEVYDNGSGIKEEELPHLFDRFYTGDKGVHGIGLSIVKSIVQSYGGRIEAQSDTKGTTFSIFLTDHKQ